MNERLRTILLKKRIQKMFSVSAEEYHRELEEALAKPRKDLYDSVQRFRASQKA